jgi:hypothetical protein
VKQVYITVLVNDITVSPRQVITALKLDNFDCTTVSPPHSRRTDRYAQVLALP